MENNPFYELRNRLYAAAAAGCSLISEDFRLQRAIEAFKPMSDTNKVFGRLYSMCSSLSSSQNIASDISDCIALADALAVTQGTFNDDSETAPASVVDIIKPVHLTMDELESYREYLRKLQYSDHYFYDPVYKNITDPRMLPSFYEIAGRNGSGVATFLSNLLMMYGESVVPLLFDSLDLYNKNSTGNQVRITSIYFRGKFNDEYIKLAENEEAAVNIRIAAIEAMQYCPENEERLLNLYKTSKGKIKHAALIALLRMSAPSIEPVMEKAAAKPKSTDWELFCESGGNAAEDYVRKTFFDLLYQAYNNVDSKKPWITGNYSLLKNKKHITDVFEKLGEYHVNNPVKLDPSRKSPRYYSVNSPLIENLYEHDDKEYIDIINSLYEKYPDVFAYSAFVAALIEDPENACKKVCRNHLLNDQDLFYVIGKIFRSPDGWYRIKRFPCITENNYENIKLFRKIPDDMIVFLSDESVIYSFDEVTAKFKSGEEIATARENMRLRCCIFSSLLRICDDDEHDRIKATAAEYTLAMAKKYPIGQVLQFLKEFGGRPLEEDIVYNYAKHSSEAINGYFTFSSTIESANITEDVIRKVCHRILNDFSDNSKLITEVKKVLEKLDAKE